MTETSFLEMSEYKEFEVDKGIERYKDFGEITVYVHYPNIDRSSRGVSKREPHRVSLYKKLKQTMKIGIQGMLITLGPMKLPKFRNLPNQ